MNSERPQRRPPSRTGRSPTGSANSSRGIACAIVAVVIGFVTLRQMNPGDFAASGATALPAAVTNTPPNTSAVTSLTQAPATSTTFPASGAALVVDGATVVVANASTTNHAAAAYAQLLQQAGFTVGTATNAAAPEKRLTTSKVYFVPGGQAAAVAASVATSMGPGIAPAPMPTSPPIAGGDLKGATVLVMLGSDLAGQPLSGQATNGPLTSLGLPTQAGTSVAG